MKTITLLRRGAQTFGLIALWSVLYPLIRSLVKGYATYIGSIFEWADVDYLYENEKGISVFFLIYFTFFYWIYLDGFFREWEITKFEFLELGMVFLNWTLAAIGFTALPPGIYGVMYYGINGLTTVPKYLTYTTAILYFIGYLLYTWIYPSKKIAEVRSWRRAQE